MHAAPRPYTRLAVVATVALAATLLSPATKSAGAQARKTSQVQQAGAPKLTPELEQVRAGLDKYKDPMAAVRDGYLSTVSCLDFPKGGMDAGVAYKPGAMGIHFVNLGNVGPTLDPTKPQVLMYEPVGDKLRLVAAEWFVPAALVKDSVAPTIFGQQLQGPMDGHFPILPKELRHYDLHVWLWKENPNGTFMPTNPAMKCPGGGYTHAEAAHEHMH